MVCARCGGLMGIDKFYDLMEQESCIGSEPARCLNCGNVEDQIIRANRPRSPVSRQGRARTVEINRSRTMQLHTSQRARHTEGASRVPPRSCSLSSWGAPSVKSQRFDSASIEQATPMVQTQRRHA